MAINLLKEFVKLESKSSVLLLLAVFMAVALANSPWSWVYAAWIEHPFAFSLSHFQAHFSLASIVNDGLMTVFFLLISLEVKRGFLIGELNSRKKAALPFIASFGGILAAALVYLLINRDSPESVQGWAIPTATDIAFSSAILLLLGKAVPRSLRLLLTTLAIIDDLGAILIIAIFYSAHFQIFYLLLAICCFLILLFLNRSGIARLPLQLGLGFLLWFFILQSHISPPTAGVLIGFTVPLAASPDGSGSPLQKLELALHPWVSYLILPIFVFVNGGLSLAHTTLSMFLNPLTLGIILGLFIGKQIGVFTSCWLAARSKLARLPDGLTWAHLYGMSVLTGIGFTMNLFIGVLAFPEDLARLNLVKLGVFSASFLSASCGYFILRRVTRRKISSRR